MPKEIYVIAVIAIVLTALVVAGAQPEDIKGMVLDGLDHYRLPAEAPPTGVSRE